MEVKQSITVACEDTGNLVEKQI